MFSLLELPGLSPEVSWPGLMLGNRKATDRNFAWFRELPRHVLPTFSALWHT